MAVDPICKMDVDEKSAKWVSEYKGNKYYFCAPGCKKQFEENPEKYTEKLMIKKKENITSKDINEIENMTKKDQITF